MSGMKVMIATSGDYLPSFINKYDFFSIVNSIRYQTNMLSSLTNDYYHTGDGYKLRGKLSEDEKNLIIMLFNSIDYKRHYFTTSDDGMYYFRYLAPGTYILTIQYPDGRVYSQYEINEIPDMPDTNNNGKVLFYDINQIEVISQSMFSVEDDFIDNRNGWETGSYPMEGFGDLNLKIVDGMFKFHVDSTRDFYEGWNSPFGTADDFDLYVNLDFLNSTSKKIDAGVMFGGPYTYYAYMISPESRQYVLWRCGASAPLIYSTGIPSGIGPPYRLRVSVKKKTFHLFINSIEVTNISDSSYKGGTIGFAIGSGEASSFSVGFERFIVQKE
jgi:hypothetical protein